jgi:hypothetical protein
MYKPVRAVAFPMIVLAALTACGGGGGGGGSTIRDVPFTSFQDVQPNQRVVMTAISETVIGNVDQFGNVSNIGASVLDEGNSAVGLTYDSSRTLSRIDINTPATSLSAGNVGCSNGVCTAENATAVIIAIDATHPAFGWNYQSYGVWTNETGPTSFQAGAISAGAVTPGSAVPLDGTATFNGLTSAFYVAGGVPFFTTAVMTADVNFGDKSIAFRSTGTQAGNLVTGFIGPRPELDLTGTLNYPAGTNRFTGTLSTSHPDFMMSGDATGRFYGPAAQEMGGTYNLSGTGGRMLGAFGGKQ